MHVCKGGHSGRAYLIYRVIQHVSGITNGGIIEAVIFYRMNNDGEKKGIT